MRFSVITVASALASVGTVSAFAGRNTAFAPSSFLQAAKTQYSSLEDKVLKSPPAAKSTPAKAAPKAVSAPAPVAAKSAPAPVVAKPAPVVQATTAADASVIPTGVALGAVPLVLAPLVLLSAGRDTLTKTKARRDELYEQIEKFEKAQEAAKNRKVNAQVDAGGLVQALGTLGAGAAALGLIIASPFTGMEGPKFEAPKSASVKETSGAKTVISAPVSRISKPISLTSPPGYNLDITPVDKNAPPPPPPKEYVGAYYKTKVTPQVRTREPVGPAGPYYLKKRPTPPPAPPKPVPAPVAPATPFYLKSKAAAPAVAPKVVQPKAAPKAAPEVPASRMNEKIAPTNEGAEEKQFAEKVVADKAARAAADAEAKAKAAEKAAAQAEKKLADEKAAEKAAADKAAADKLVVEELEAKKAAQQAERAKAEAEKVAAEKAAAAKAIADAEKEQAAAKPVAAESKPVETPKAASSKETLSAETLQLLKKYNKK